MDDQKIENLLNLALSSTEEEREKSLNLNVGYQPQTGTWDLIVKYSGSLQTLEREGLVITELLNEYAIVTIREDLIIPFSQLPQVEYIEKPKRLFFAVSQGKTASCINPVQTGRNGLTGKGVIVAVIDSGIDYTHPDFRNADGTTRLLSLWDQTVTGSPPEGYRTGTLYTREDINRILETTSSSLSLQPPVSSSPPASSAAQTTSSFRQLEEIPLPSTDTQGHGTAVAGIAAGNGSASNGIYRGIAYESDIIAVKLGIPQSTSFPRTTELMLAINYVIEQAISFGRPLVVNLSFGNSYGSHDGTSLLEQFIDSVANLGRTSIIIGSGNEGAARGHTEGVLPAVPPGSPSSLAPVTEIELAVSPSETLLNVQLWKYFVDDFQVSIITPSGQTFGPFSERQDPGRYRMRNSTLLVYYGQPSPYSSAQEIYFDFLADDVYLEGGIYRIRLVPRSIVNGRYDLWLPGSSVLNRSTGFLTPVPDTTLTIPSTASRAITVGAYDSSYLTYADFSGRGYTRTSNLVKPDLAAPGVGIVTTSVGGGYETATGTSFATPFVTGSAALLMQWGIVEGNDPYLYGEKLKAYLLRGARPLSSERKYPNPKLGYGTLCLRDSIP